MTLKEQAEALGIDTVDSEGKLIHHKTLKKLIDDLEPETEQVDQEIDDLEDEEPESTEENKDGFKPGQAVSSEDLLKHMAKQRQLTHKVQPANKVKKKDKRKNRSKIHGGAISKVK